MKKSLHAQQDPVLMAFFKQELQHLQAAHQQGQLSLWFYEESGFGLNPTGLYVWQSAGSRVYLPAQRGQGFTVAGFWQPGQQLQAYSYSGRTSSAAFIGFVEDWLKTHPPVGKTVVVLDNASFHTSSDVVTRRKEWAYLQYLPAYGSDRAAGAVKPDRNTVAPSQTSVDKPRELCIGPKPARIRRAYSASGGS